MSLCIQYINSINSYCTWEALHVPQQGQLCKGLPHCTQLRELELKLDLSRSDEVRHVTLYPIHQQYKLLLYLGGSACTPTRAVL